MINQASRNVRTAERSQPPATKREPRLSIPRNSLIE
jgi:hypothetical protein